MAAQILLMEKAKVRARPVRPVALIAPTTLVRAKASRRHLLPQNEDEREKWVESTYADLAHFSPLKFAYGTTPL